jgi:hypothetical protein
MSVTATHRYQLDLQRGARLILVEPVPDPETHERHGQSSSDLTYSLSLQGPVLSDGVVPEGPATLSLDVSHDQLRELRKLLDCALTLHDALVSRLL